MDSQLNVTMTKHAQIRCQQRGIKRGDVESILTHADVENPAGDGAVVISISRQRAKFISVNDVARRCAVILSEDGVIITACQIHNTRHGKAWRRGFN